MCYGKMHHICDPRMLDWNAHKGLWADAQSCQSGFSFPHHSTTGLHGQTAAMALHPCNEPAEMLVQNPVMRAMFTVTINVDCNAGTKATEATATGSAKGGCRMFKLVPWMVSNRVGVGQATGLVLDRVVLHDGIATDPPIAESHVGHGNRGQTVPLMHAGEGWSTVTDT